jgi:hypothetical protein
VVFRLLRARGERPSRRAADERDELTPFHRPSTSRAFPTKEIA